MHQLCKIKVTRGVLVAVLLSFGTYLNAQSITGTVTDESNAAVANAKVQVKNTNTGVTQTVTTNNQGRYTVPELSIGNYEVQATNPGFQTAVRSGINLTVGSQVVVDFKLQVGQAQQSVTVEGAVTQVDTTSATVGQLVEQTQIRELPLNGRNFSQLLTLAAGVTQLPATGGSFYGGGNNYSVAGARPQGQAFLLDGTNINGFWNKSAGSGATGTSLGVEAIAEFQTLTNTYGAQYGGSGSVVNAVSKAGTNDFHGSAYYFMRNSAMDSRNFFDGANLPPFRRHQFGGSIGGPIKTDKMFFFANYEGLRQSLTSTRVANVPDADAHNGIVNGVNVGVSPSIKATLDLYPVATGPSKGGIGQVALTDNEPAHENYFLGRWDYNITDTDQIFARYVSDRADQITRSTIPLWPATGLTRNHYATVEEKHIFGPTVVNSFRAAFVRPEERAEVVPTHSALQFFPGSGRPDGTVAVNGLTGIGAAATLPYYLIPNRYSLADDVFWNKGAHNISMGFEILRVRHSSWAPFQLGASWNFNSLTDFLQGNASVLNAPRLGEDDSYRDLREWYYTPYINDEWKISSRLTLNLGLRYLGVGNPTEARDKLYAFVAPPADPGFEHVPHAFATNPAKWNFDPRFGFAWDVFGDHKTSVRGGFGIFHNVVSPREYAPGFWLGKPFIVTQQNFPVYPTPFAGGGAPPKVAMNQGADYRIDTTPYMMQYNLNIQRQITSNTVLTIGYVGSKGLHLMRQRDLNSPVPTFLPDGTPVFGTLVGTRVVPNPRQNPNFGALSLRTQTAWGSSRYNSLQITLNRRFTRNLQYQITYVFSKSMDDGSTSFGLESVGADSAYIMNPFNGNWDWGRSAFDRTHTFRISGVYALPFQGNKFIQGWQFSGIMSATSGGPFTANVGFDRAGLVTATAQRVSLKAGANPNPNLGTVDRWFDPSAFALPEAGHLGNLGRNTVIGPTLVNTDIALTKDTKIPAISETFSVQFRAEAFNVFNHANFGLPNRNVFTPTGAVSGSAGRITSTVVPARQLQLALKFVF